MVDLHYGLRPAGTSQFFGTEQACQKAAAVTQVPTLDKFESGQR
jgi:hypothetical protein